MKGQITGILHKVQDAKQITEKFSKRSLIVEIPDEKYPQYISVDFMGNDISKLDEYTSSEGCPVTVDFYFTGRESKGNYYNTLKGFNVRVEGKKEKPVQKESPKPVQYTEPISEGIDDLPF